MRLNETIRRLRNEAHISQETLGNHLGVSGQAVSKWEQGITSPDISLLPAIAEYFGVTIDALFKDTAERRYYGYSSHRCELLAEYLAKGGTDNDFQHVAELYAEELLNGSPTIEDYVDYAELFSCRADKDAETAIRYYRKAIMRGDATRGSVWMRAHQELTNRLFRCGRAEEAITEARKWTETEPCNAWSHVALAYALDSVGQLSAACDEIQLALEIEENDANVQQAAGALFANAGRYDEAFIHWDKAFQLMPSSISCLFSKAAAYEKMGRKEDAIRQYREILDWLEAHGFNMKIEGKYPISRIESLS